MRGRTDNMNDYITFEQLCQETGISKYKLRFFQKLGYFEALDWGMRKPPCDGCHYDRRWVTMWKECLEYKKAGLEELEALDQAHTDVFMEQ
jgi:hypothetical protein